MLQCRNINSRKFNAISRYLGFEVTHILDTGAIVAGGCMRTLVAPTDVINDVDIFFTGRGQVEPVEELLLMFGYTVVFRCPAGDLISFKKNNSKVQLITKYTYMNATSLVWSFDVVPCCAAYSAIDGFVCDENFIKSVKKKILMLNRIEYPVATLKRISKYIAYGYKPTPDFYVDVAVEINRLKLTQENLILYVD